MFCQMNEFKFYINFINWLLILFCSFNIIDSTGQSNGDFKRTAANRLTQSQSVNSQSNTISNSIELLEMKEKICAGFLFTASGINCTFQISKESISISAAFPECKQIMINRCKRKQSEDFCEKGKLNALKITSQSSSLIARLSDRIETSILPSIDCFLNNQENLLQLYGLSINSYSKCCSICQKGKLFAIELNSCKHKFYTDPILEQTFNECCFARLYQIENNKNSFLKNTQSLNEFINNDFEQNNGHQTQFAYNFQTNLNSHFLDDKYVNKIKNQAIESNEQIVTNQVKTNEFNIYQQIKLNVDIEKLYLNKAKLMFETKKNQTIMSNLTESEKDLMKKALDTTKLDFTIKYLTSMLKLKTNTVSNNNMNKKNQNTLLLFEQLHQILNDDEKKWSNNNTVTPYSNTINTQGIPLLDVNIDELF